MSPPRFERGRSVRGRVPVRRRRIPASRQTRAVGPPPSAARLPQLQAGRSDPMFRLPSRGPPPLAPEGDIHSRGHHIRGRPYPFPVRADPTTGPGGRVVAKLVQRMEYFLAYSPEPGPCPAGPESDPWAVVLSERPDIEPGSLVKLSAVWISRAGGRGKGGSPPGCVPDWLAAAPALPRTRYWIEGGPKGPGPTWRHAWAIFGQS